ncbi:N-acetylglucosamine kinase [Streptomyces cavernicola]|uniref:BadF/BadG/BcrA/BcrD ATPase family protein n=1 Tax=Streptomyces cavernicola TaxID=3043613 RepID=A0ABT6S6X0_9ACTN|nr:BadF/BadG/BcrA/BcrD ATPase family protein [Streptomyces sp. B-S-A6]MDI3403825.1 BadF/BadG/BcrA/BcrD ATPase family protein [Streptomyces sp. B-S-A6]
MTAAATPDVPWVVGVDSGGSGLRVALAPAGGDGPPRTLTSREPVRTGPAGIDAGHLMQQLGPMARELIDGAGGGAVAAVAVGSAGMATLGGDLRERLPAALDGAFGTRRLALAADAVTAYAGALGQRPGAVVAAGTGLIALGTDLRSWRRADGWGHLLGDCGGGAWIGRAGLDAAMRAYDGRRGCSPALRARAEAVFDGPLNELPGKLYPRTDRPAVLASFAPEVARCAPHDPVAEGILREAARHIAEAAVAVCPSGTECEVALTGGLFKMGAPLVVPLEEELAAQLPAARVSVADGDPLDGAVVLARALAAGTLRLPHDGRMLHLP